LAEKIANPSRLFALAVQLRFQLADSFLGCRRTRSLRIGHGLHLHAGVLFRVGANVDPQRDVRFTMGPIDVLDHASRAFTYGSKMGIDATRKWPDEGFAREWPDVLTMPAEVKAKVDLLWRELGIG